MTEAGISDQILCLSRVFVVVVVGFFLGGMMTARGFYLKRQPSFMSSGLLSTLPTYVIPTCVISVCTYSLCDCLYMFPMLLIFIEALYE